MPAATMNVPSACGGNERVMDGYLNHIIEQKSALRYVVLENNSELGHMYLSVYRKSNGIQTENDLKKRYEFTQDNFVGTERGTINEGAKRRVLYWAIILKEETVLFKDKEATDKSKSEFERWNDMVKHIWNHQSWEVSPVDGPAIAEHPKLILHLNSASLCLALLSPPRHYLRWPLTRVTPCECDDCRFSFNITGSDRPGFYEVKLTRSKYASKLKALCSELLEKLPDQLRPAPKPPCRRLASQEKNVCDDFLTVPDPHTGPSSLGGPHPIQREANNRASGTSTGEGIYKREGDTASIASFDSFVSNPSPTVIPEREGGAPQDSFVFPPDSTSIPNDMTRDSLDQDHPKTSPRMSGVKTSPLLNSKPFPPVQSPRSKASPYHVAFISTDKGTSLHPEPEAGICLGDMIPPLNHISNLELQHPRPPPPGLCATSHASMSHVESTQNLPAGPFSVHAPSTPPPPPPSSSPQHLPSLPQIPPLCSLSTRDVQRNGCQKESVIACRSSNPQRVSMASKDAHNTYMNTRKGTDIVDTATMPKEPNMYMNVDNNSHYANPTLQEPPRKDDLGPSVPPRSKVQPPQVPRRRKRYEVHELVSQAKTGKLKVMDLLSSPSKLKEFCMHFDIKKDVAPLKDWTALAERVGITKTGIDLVNFHTISSPCGTTATEIVLAYWETSGPDNMPYTKEQLIQELEALDRHDLIRQLNKAEHRT